MGYIFDYISSVFSGSQYSVSRFYDQFDAVIFCIFDIAEGVAFPLFGLSWYWVLAFIQRIPFCLRDCDLELGK